MIYIVLYLIFQTHSGVDLEVVEVPRTFLTLEECKLAGESALDNQGRKSIYIDYTCAVTT